MENTQGAGERPKWQGSELPHLALVCEPQEPVKSAMYWDMEVGILEIQGHYPSSLRHRQSDRLGRLHGELGDDQKLVQG